MKCALCPNEADDSLSLPLCGKQVVNPDKTDDWTARAVCHYCHDWPVHSPRNVWLSDRQVAIPQSKRLNPSMPSLEIAVRSIPGQLKRRIRSYRAVDWYYPVDRLRGIADLLGERYVLVEVEWR